VVFEDVVFLDVLGFDWGVFLGEEVLLFWGVFFVVGGVFLVILGVDVFFLKEEVKDFWGEIWVVNVVVVLCFLVGGEGSSSKSMSLSYDNVI